MSKKRIKHAIDEIKRPRLRSLVGRHKSYGKYFVWLKDMATREISETTIEIKFSNLSTLEANYGLDLDGDVENISDVATRITNSELANATKNLYRLSLRQWCDFRKIDLDEDTTKSIADKKAGNGDKARKLTSNDLISWEEFTDICAHTKDPSLDAFFAVLYDTGSRPGETVALNVGDVTLTDAGHVISFSHDVKTEHSQREVILGVVNEKCDAIFGKWFELHPLKNKPKAPLFLNREGGRLSQDVATHRLNYHEERLKRGKGKKKVALHLYLFRKTAITMMLRQKRLTEIEIKLRIGHKRNSTVLETFYDIRDGEDQNNAQKKAKGIVVEDDDFSRLTCLRCGKLNEVKIDVCEKCSYPLTSEAIKREHNLMKARVVAEMSVSIREQIEQELNKRLELQTTYQLEDELRQSKDEARKYAIEVGRLEDRVKILEDFLKKYPGFGESPRE